MFKELHFQNLNQVKFMLIILFFSLFYQISVPKLPVGFESAWRSAFQRTKAINYDSNVKIVVQNLVAEVAVNNWMRTYCLVLTDKERSLHFFVLSLSNVMFRSIELMTYSQSTPICYKKMNEFRSSEGNLRSGFNFELKNEEDPYDRSRILELAAETLIKSYQQRLNNV